MAASRIDQVSLECRNSRVPIELIGLLKGKDVLVGCIDVASNVVETPEDVAATIRAALAYVPAERLYPCTNCGMAPMAADDRLRQARVARGGGRAGAQGDAITPLPLIPSLSREGEVGATGRCARHRERKRSDPGMKGRSGGSGSPRRFAPRDDDSGRMTRAAFTCP